MNEEIITLIAELLKVPDTKISLDTVIGDMSEWDSLNHWKIIATLESKYSIKFAVEDLNELEDVSDLINLIKDLKA